VDLPPEVQKAVPGVAGSLTALLFFRGESARRSIGLCIAGAALASVFGAPVAEVMHSSAAVGGYATGLFGMAIVAKVFDMITGFDARKAANDLWAAVIKRVKG